MKKKTKKIIGIVALSILLLFSSIGLVELIKRERIRRAEEEAALRAKEEAERIAAEKEAARIAAEEEKKRKEEDRRTRNPLTGLKMNESAIGKRPVAFMVENTPPARPQWGMDDVNYAPDIILEAEVEGGISRMLWIWADYNKMPYMVGPVRSARPPFVRFSEFFDAMFVHWGMSETGGGYTGADYYFWNDGVNHLDGMYYESSGPFGRNWSSGRSSEHLAVVYGGILPGYLESYFNTARRPERTTELSFYRDKEPRGPKASCQELDVKFSRISGSTHWSYDSKTQKYYTPSFKTNASRDNLLILMDTTYYVTKVSTTYCNYNFAGGDAYLASCGAVENIKWRVENGKLRLYRNVPVKNADGTETTVEETVSLNPGKTYIGWASSNYGGYCTITPGEAAPEPSKAFVYDEPTMFRGYW